MSASEGVRENGRIGMWMFLAADAMSFAALIFAYGYLRRGAGQWPGSRLALGFAAAMTIVLASSSLTMRRALAATRAGRRNAAAAWLAVTMLAGLVFVGGQAREYAALVKSGIGLATDRMSSTFFVCTGFHGAHVVAGVAILAIVGLRAARAGDAARLHVVGLFWHFVDVVWLFVFTAFYLV
jgi:heme/copper-type cytochrome/quinol oxidase subunit 3